MITLLNYNIHIEHYTINKSKMLQLILFLSSTINKIWAFYFRFSLFLFLCLSLYLSYTKTYADTPTWDCPSVSEDIVQTQYHIVRMLVMISTSKEWIQNSQDPKSTIFITQKKQQLPFLFLNPFLVTTTGKKIQIK